MSEKPAFPQQPLVWDDTVIRFRENRIVRFLLDAGPFDLNQLAHMPFDDDEREQLAQLLGYSVGGFMELDFVSDSAAETANEALVDAMKGAELPPAGPTDWDIDAPAHSDAVLTG